MGSHKEPGWLCHTATYILIEIPDSGLEGGEGRSGRCHGAVERHRCLGQCLGCSGSAGAGAGRGGAQHEIEPRDNNPAAHPCVPPCFLLSGGCGRTGQQAELGSADTDFCVTDSAYSHPPAQNCGCSGSGEDSSSGQDTGLTLQVRRLPGGLSNSMPWRAGRPGSPCLEEQPETIRAVDSIPG